jgi:hypothetical protein
MQASKGATGCHKAATLASDTLKINFISHASLAADL